MSPMPLSWHLASGVLGKRGTIFTESSIFVLSARAEERDIRRRCLERYLAPRVLIGVVIQAGCALVHRSPFRLDDNGKGHVAAYKL
jgi:hypothetical protein